MIEHLCGGLLRSRPHCGDRLPAHRVADSARVGRRLGRAGSTALAVSLALSAPTATAAAPTLRPRIVSGSIANRGETPWFVLLRPVHRDGSEHLCGGTAISERWIVTAAHCVVDAVEQTGRDIGGTERDLVLVGRKRSSAYVNPVRLGKLGKRIRWKRIVVYPGYVAATRLDIALIETAAPMKRVRPLAYSSDASRAAESTPYRVYGFGTTTYGGTQPSERLLVATVYDHTPVDGDDWYSPCSGGSPGYFVGGDVLCAVNLAPNSPDSCQGDSGGPLVSALDTPKLVGIVSWGDACGLGDGFRSVYTKVGFYADWIGQVTGVPPGTS
jgi:secreted trypsin-like serine protease